MFKNWRAAATLVVGLVGLVGTAMAQDRSAEFRPFNGLFADLFDDGAQQPRPSQHYHKNSTGVRNSMEAPRYQRTPARPSAQPPLQPQADPLNETPSASGRGGVTHTVVAPPPRRPVTSRDYTFQWDEASPPSAPASAPVAAPPATAAAAPSPPSPTGAPLHERLKQYRQSPFVDVASKPAGGAALMQPSESSPAGQPTPAAQPTAAGQPTPASPAPSVASNEQQHPTKAEPPPAAVAKPAAETSIEPSVLSNRQTPQLSVETIGPRKIVVGKEASYEVHLQNNGDQAAEEITVSVALPEWAEVAGASASTGEVQAARAGQNEPYRWTLPRIEARSKERLALKIVPNQSKPFELAVHWDFKHKPSEAMIEVQEPKLTMRLDGPREVLFGKREVYKLMVGNSGNGTAENVVLTLMPLNAGESRALTHRLGALAAGEERTIEVELTARQAGKVTIRVEANGDAGAHVDIAENVVVHKAALQVDVEGPAVQYVGTPANYKIIVRNPGDAPAKNVKLTAKLPTGVKYLSGTDGAAAETTAAGGKVQWTFDVLQPAEQKVLQMRCSLALSGNNRLEFSSAADEELVATAESLTRVEAVADLRMEVKDPEGPVPVGSETVYELHIRNRGTKAAENVEVLAYFSNGIEPVSAEGHAGRVGPGQVVFAPIGAIAPAAELVLRVKAKAETAGSHVFRAEVHCRTIGTRLVREQATHYYQDGATVRQASLAGKPQPPAPAADEPPGGDRQPRPLPQASGQPLPTRAIRK